jgi:hypothetical protein
MSTKTNFKRIALVAVAALGLGLLSSAPSQAAVDQVVISGVANGTASPIKADSTTAATFTVTAMMNVAGDYLQVSLVPKIGTTATAWVNLVDTKAASTYVDTNIASTGPVLGTAAKNARSLALVNNHANTRGTLDTVGVFGGVTSGKFDVATDTTVVTNGFVSAGFRVQIESLPASAELAAGTYSYTAIIRSFDAGTVNALKTVYQDVSIVVSLSAAATASAATLVNGAQSSITLGNTVANLSGTTSTSTDSTIAVLSTAGTTAAGFVRVRLRNAAGGNAQESVTATISAGRIGVTGGTSFGRNVTFAYTANMVTAGFVDLEIQPDGTAGTATIGVSTTSWTAAGKSVSFYSSTPDKITAGAYASVIGGSGIGVYGNESAGGIDFGAGTALYAYSSDTSIISSYGSACTYVSAAKAALCTLTGVKNGTAKITLRDAATVAASVAASSPVEVKVNTNPAATVALAFDKPSYAPGEKATLKITVKDAAGATLPAATYSNLFATGGLTTSSSIGSAVSSTVLSSVSVVTMSNITTSTDTPIVTLDPIGQVTFFTPLSGGTITITGKGGTSLPTAGQVTVTATATVADSGAAALAAVTALATTVASLKTLITTLTNLVLKIQKKVKA